MRIEKDSFGEISVPEETSWGAQTQRSLQFFAIGIERMPPAVLIALLQIKRAAALVNAELGLLDQNKAQAIAAVAQELITHMDVSEFPLSIWQTGSGTQTNMNVNEVLANRASLKLGGTLGTKRLVHPNDDVNLGQSSNDVFPTAMHLATACSVQQELLPALQRLHQIFQKKSQEFAAIIKIGRTHLQDATPITLGQEFSGYTAQLKFSDQAIRTAIDSVHELALGGTAVGTGLNTHPEFSQRVAAKLAQELGLPFTSGKNKFELLASHNRLVYLHSTLKVLATSLHKIANDVRWLASGPRSGLGEIAIPENEPGSSIMPGKVNPTQCEALTMVCCQVCANDVAIGMAEANGAFELNVYKPLIIYSLMQSVRLLTDSMDSFNTHCVQGITANQKRIGQLLDQSLMLVTALAPHIGYDRASAIAKKAHAEESTLKQAAIALGYVSEEEFNEWVQPKQMI